MGHIRIRKDKNGKERYQILVEVWHGGRKFYKSKTCNSKREALNWEGKIKHEIRSGILTPETLKNRKLSEAIDKFISQVLPQKPKNSKNVKQHLSWWQSEIGNFGLSDISPSLIAEMRDKLLQEPTPLGKARAPATVVRYLSSLSSVYEAAIREWHWVEKNPVRQIRKPSVSNARVRFLSEDECQRLLTACRESKNAYLFPVVAIAIGSGMRRGEILDLRWQDIDFNKKMIFLGKTKNGTSRFVPMVGLVLQVLLELYQKEKIIDFSFFIFPSINPNKQLEIRTAWEYALKRANISNLKFHDLRHSCASFLAMTGASQRDIAEILGHKDLKMTFRYSHLSNQHLAEALERASDRFIANAEKNN